MNQCSAVRYSKTEPSVCVQMVRIPQDHMERSGHCAHPGMHLSCSMLRLKIMMISSSGLPLKVSLQTSISNHTSSLTVMSLYICWCRGWSSRSSVHLPPTAFGSSSSSAAASSSGCLSPWPFHESQIQEVGYKLLHVAASFIYSCPTYSGVVVSE
jgi:hypothetical protein